MSKKQIEPTNSMVGGVELGHKLMQMDVRAILRAGLNHPDAAGLFAGEGALRAAREQGWDQATRWIDSYQGGPNGRTTSARSANPYRPAPVLPTKPGAVIVPADGHKHITATVGGVTYRAREAIFSCSVLWLGVWRSIDSTAVSALPEDITPGTWKVEGE